VNVFAVYAVNSHIERLLEDAAERRAAKAGKPSLGQRIAAFRDAIRDAIEDAADTAPKLIPTATGYPYRS
jgi:hypothetical protein